MGKKWKAVSKDPSRTGKDQYINYDDEDLDTFKLRISKEEDISFFNFIDPQDVDDDVANYVADVPSDSESDTISNNSESLDAIPQEQQQPGVPSNSTGYVIALIVGGPGSGKTSVGQLVGSTLGVPFMEVDRSFPEGFALSTVEQRSKDFIQDNEQQAIAEVAKKIHDAATPVVLTWHWLDRKPEVQVGETYYLWVSDPKEYTERLLETRNNALLNASGYEYWVFNENVGKKEAYDTTLKKWDEYAAEIVKDVRGKEL
jgi:hypothetical protein